MKKNLLFPAYIAVILAFLFVSAPEVFAKDEWISVRSKNFSLIGNASEKDIRKAATKLEQFRETFRALFAKTNLSSSIPTNVVVFRNDSAYKPFKPKRSDGKPDDGIAGYFQPGQDVNYITLSAGGNDDETYGTIFHEFVHFIIDTNFGKSDIPAWFNEGLAEYYQTFEIDKDIKVKLGLPQGNHLLLLQQSELLPLETLFKISNYQLHQQGNHSRSVFYAQSWALIHYMVQTGKADGLNKFLNLSLKNKTQEAAFTEAFGMSYKEMEKELRKYVRKATFNYSEITFRQKLVFDDQMMIRPLSDAETNAYLGDLLYHTNRFDDAEPYLVKAIELDPGSTMAATALGMVKFRQNKFTEAERFLESAVAQNSKSHMAHYWYAFVLSRSGQNEFGFVSGYAPEKAGKIKASLSEAIRIKPDFTESYELFAFVNLVNNEDLDDSVAKLRQALKYQPGNQRYALRIAEILLRQRKFKDANTIAAKIAETTDDPQIRQRAENLVTEVSRNEQIAKQNEENRRRFEKAMAENDGKGGNIIVRADAEEMEAFRKERAMIELGRRLRTVSNGEVRVIGRITKITCPAGTVVYDIKEPAGEYTLTTVNFDELNLNAYEIDPTSDVGCGADLSSMNAVLTYVAGQKAGSDARGELVSIEFVPDDFRFIDKPTLAPPRVTVTGDRPNVPDQIDEEERRKAIEDAQQKAVTEMIAKNIGKTAPGQKRIIGSVRGVECRGKRMILAVSTGETEMKFLIDQQTPPSFRSFTPKVQGIQIACGSGPIPARAVVTFTDDPNKKAKTVGTLVSVDMVPDLITLEQL